MVIGCMTGTSIDGIDAALVEVRGRGLAITASFVDAVSRPLGAMAEGLRGLASGLPLPAGAITELMWAFGELHADVAAELAARHAGTKVDLVCVHGQTVYHARGRSWQLIQPAPITRALRAPVVFDLRAADLASGGQGAPITPIADWVLFRHESVSRMVVNLGGFCNVTELPAGLHRAGAHPPDVRESLGLVRARDVCACNQLLDALARTRLGCAFDRDGREAELGARDQQGFESLRDLLGRQSLGGRSLGTGDEVGNWVQASQALAPRVVLRTACDAIASVIADAGGADEILLGGGGVRNRALVESIRQEVTQRRGGAARATPSVRPTDELGIPAAYREAVEFAVLGALCQDRVAITLPAVTGCREPAPISGAWVFP